MLSENEGKYVVIQSDRVAGVWDTCNDALKAGYARFGLEPFLIKQILVMEPVLFFTRELVACRS